MFLFNSKYDKKKNNKLNKNKTNIKQQKLNNHKCNNLLSKPTQWDRMSYCVFLCFKF